MYDNPWEHWLKSLLEEDLLDRTGLFESPEARTTWRRLADKECNQYQKTYARTSKLKPKQSQPLRQIDLSSYTAWWQPFVSNNEDTWSYLDQLEHPFDSQQELNHLGLDRPDEVMEE